MGRHLLHEFVHELGHFLVRHTLEQKKTKEWIKRCQLRLHQNNTNLLAQAEVQRILKELLIVGSQVKADRKRGRWMNSSTSDIEGQFSDGDRHPVDTEVAQTQNP